MPHAESTILFQLFVIFISATAAGKAFEKLRMPGVLGEIIAGIVFGPSVLAMVNLTEPITSIAELGAIFLLFTVGLEMHPQQLIKIGHKALGVADAGIFVSFAMGSVFLFLSGNGMKVASIVAAALVATSVGISARVLRDLKALESYAARIILGAAVFDDVLAMILLAVIGELVDSQGVHLVAPWHLDSRVGCICSIHGFAGSSNRAPGRCCNQKSIHQQRTVNHRAGGLSGLVCGDHADRLGRNCRGVFCGVGPGGIREPMAAWQEFSQHQSIPLAILLFCDGRPTRHIYIEERSRHRCRSGRHTTGHGVKNRRLRLAVDSGRVEDRAPGGSWNGSARRSDACNRYDRDENEANLASILCSPVVRDCWHDPINSRIIAVAVSRYSRAE
ncbi:MAG: cation:proton antiporter [Acidobacteriia bacterium]|nr:cation:proton antiporter [Terriglobia bacterium]